MATVNYSVPDEVKERFNATFEGRNKSRIIARLMAQAVEDEERHRRRAAAIESLSSRRGIRPTVTAAQRREARDAGRP